MAYNLSDVCQILLQMDGCCSNYRWSCGHVFWGDTNVYLGK